MGITLVKMCGLMNKKDLRHCVQAGVNMVGFVTDYPEPVSWNISKDEARELIAEVPFGVSSCIVTGGSADKVLKLTRETSPNFVQLHHRETLQDIKKIARELSRCGIKTIKALRLKEDGFCDFEIPDSVQAVKELAQTGITAVLVDTYSHVSPGGTGVRVRTEEFLRIKKNSSLPVILAGGLNHGNIFEIIRAARPYGVDVLTGIEEKPGQKDPVKIMSFMGEVSRASQLKLN